MPKVSIIIPIYNVEKYLRKCMNSVCGQTLSDIEIICVNDCSPDNSLEILKEYASKDNRIKIINFEKNKGVSVARNTGIDNATGEFIGFVDADDFIDLDFYEKLYNRAIETGNDLIIGTVQIETEHNIKQNDYILNDVLDKIKEKSLYFNQLFWLGLYKTSLLKDYSIKFIENCIYGEDRLLPLQSSYYANKTEIVNDAFYHYVRNNSSITKSKKNEKIVDSFLLSLKRIFDFINNTAMSIPDYTLVCDCFLDNSLSFSLALDTSLKTKYYKKFKNEIFVLLNKEKLKNSDLYKNIEICLKEDILESFENFAKKYMNKLMFNCIRKHLEQKKQLDN